MKFIVSEPDPTSPRSRLVGALACLGLSAFMAHTAWEKWHGRSKDPWPTPALAAIAVVALAAGVWKLRRVPAPSALDGMTVRNAPSLWRSAAQLVIEFTTRWEIAGNPIEIPVIVPFPSGHGAYADTVAKALAAAWNLTEDRA